jgi:hypothetical protein
MKVFPIDHEDRVAACASAAAAERRFHCPLAYALDILAPPGFDAEPRSLTSAAPNREAPNREVA